MVDAEDSIILVKFIFSSSEVQITFCSESNDGNHLTNIILTSYMAFEIRFRYLKNTNLRAGEKNMDSIYDPCFSILWKTSGS